MQCFFTTLSSLVTFGIRNVCSWYTFCLMSGIGPNSLKRHVNIFSINTVLFCMYLFRLIAVVIRLIKRIYKNVHSCVGC